MPLRRWRIAGALHQSVARIENDRAALEVLQANLEYLGLRDCSTVVRGDVLSRLDQIANASLVIADPPYEFDRWAELFQRVSGQLVVAESDRELDAESPPIDGWEAIRSKRYGRAFVTFFQRLA